jgi:signal transduction histidine kinase
VGLRDPEFGEWLFDSLRSGAVAIDAGGLLVGLNEVGRRLLGCEVALGTDARRTLAGQPNLLRMLLETLGGAERPTRAELELEPVGASAPRTIGFTLVPVLDASGALRGAAALFRDLQPIERMDEQERLRERLAALGQMAAGLAHEIRNPLASMEVLAGLLKRQLGDRDEERELVEELLGELRSLAETVRASLDFVKPAAPAWRPVDVAMLVDEVLARTLARVPFAGEVRSELPQNLPPMEADPDQLRVVVSNLVVNAIEALAGLGGAARLSVSVAVCPVDRSALRLRVGRAGSVREDGSAGQELWITVADNGPGVAEELRERIFYPFFTTRESGSGVGLALAQKLVASLGGALELETAEGRGARFRVRLPLREAQP